MEHLPKKIHQNGISYTLVGDYYIPDLELPEESRPIGRWGRMHKAFLQEHRPGQYNALLLSGKLWTYLADLNEQAADRLACIVSQMQEAEGVTEELKARDQLAWVGGMNSIRSRAEDWQVTYPAEAERPGYLPALACIIACVAFLSLHI